MIHAFGDSFVVGDQDDFIHELGYDPGHGMHYLERVEYLKYNISFVSLIAKELNIPLKNYAERGSGNFPQLDKLTASLESGSIKSSDLVLFGITSPSRDRLSFVDNDRVTSESFGPCLIDRELANFENVGKIPRLDTLYILFILEQLSKIFGVRILKFNLFDVDLNISYPFKDYLSGGTLLDILNDTWGKDIKTPYHDKISIPKGYEKFYSLKKHPSETGHKKIAEWLLKNVEW